MVFQSLDENVEDRKRLAEAEIRRRTSYASDRRDETEPRAAEAALMGSWVGRRRLPRRPARGAGDRFAAHRQGVRARRGVPPRPAARTRSGRASSSSLPGIDKLVRVDLRTVTLTIPPQEVITRDNVTARVNAVVLFRVTDPTKSVMAVENFAVATSQIAQTTLRSVVGRADLDTLLAHRADLNEDLAASIANQTRTMGRSRSRSSRSRTSRFPR